MPMINHDVHAKMEAMEAEMAQLLARAKESDMLLEQAERWKKEAEKFQRQSVRQADVIAVSARARPTRENQHNWGSSGADTRQGWFLKKIALV